MTRLDTQITGTTLDTQKAIKILQQVSPHLFQFPGQTLATQYPRYKTLQETPGMETFFSRLQKGEVTYSELKALLEVEREEISEYLIHPPQYLREPKPEDRVRVDIQRKIRHIIHQLEVYDDILLLNQLLRNWGITQCTIPQALQAQLEEVKGILHKIFQS